MAVVEKILKNGKKAYAAAVRDRSGKWFPRTYFPTWKQADDHETLLKSQKKKGARAPVVNQRALTLSRYYYDTYKNEARTEVTQGQRNTENQLFRDHIEPYMGGKKIIDIKKNDISKTLGDLTTSKNLGWQQRTHVYNLLKQIFQRAIDSDDLIEWNPVLKLYRPKKIKSIARYFKPDEGRDFLELVQDHWVGPSAWTMTATGLRVGEVMGLQFGDIDFKRNIITMVRQWSRKNKEIRLVKNGEVETVIPMPLELAEYLSTKLKGYKATDWVVQSRKTPGGIACYNTIYKTIVNLEAKHGMKHVSPHGLRHTTSGIWNEQGVKKDDLQKLYNHKSGAITDHYNHEAPSGLVEVSKTVRLKKTKIHLKVVQ